MKIRVPAALALTCIPLILCHCDDGGANIKLKGLKDEIEQLNHQNYETQQQVTRLQSQIEASRTEKKKIEEDKAKVEAERTDAAKQLDQLRRDFETYKSKYKLSMRQRAPGLNVGSFTTDDGKTYQNVVLREITDSQVNFNHEGGIMKVHYKQLPLKLQDMLGYLIESVSTAPKEVKMLSPKQQNANARNAYELRITQLDGVLKDLRLKKEQATRNLSTAHANKVSAINNGNTGIKEGAVVEKCEMVVKQIDGEILQAEVDLHAARSQPIPRVSER